MNPGPGVPSCRRFAPFERSCNPVGTLQTSAMSVVLGSHPRRLPAASARRRDLSRRSRDRLSRSQLDRPRRSRKRHRARTRFPQRHACGRAEPFPSRRHPGGSHSARASDRAGGGAGPARRTGVGRRRRAGRPGPAGAPAGAAAHPELRGRGGNPVHPGLLRPLARRRASTWSTRAWSWWESTGPRSSLSARRTWRSITSSWVAGSSSSRGWISHRSQPGSTSSSACRSGWRVWTGHRRGWC